MRMLAESGNKAKSSISGVWRDPIVKLAMWCGDAGQWVARLELKRNGGKSASGTWAGNGLACFPASSFTVRGVSIVSLVLVVDIYNGLCGALALWVPPLPSFVFKISSSSIHTLASLRPTTDTIDGLSLAVWCSSWIKY
jgi:hypothetical protein